MAEARTVEDRLRDEYFDLLAQLRRALVETETRTRTALLDLSLDLQDFERLRVVGRVKDCQSAVDALRRRKPLAMFDEAASYTLTELPDLVGVRVMAFPPRRLQEAQDALQPLLAGWRSDPVRAEDKTELAAKWTGKWDVNAPFPVEVQAVSLLVGLFWEVEHDAIYKADPRFRGVLGKQDVREAHLAVYNALRQFEETFETAVATAPPTG